MDYDDPARTEIQEDTDEHLRREEERVANHIRRKNRNRTRGLADEIEAIRLINSVDE